MPEFPEIVRAARALPEQAHVPYAFENRIMAAIRGCKPVDVLAFWNQTLWRAALACVAISVLTGALARLGPENGSQGELLSAELEQTVLAPLTLNESW